MRRNESAAQCVLGVSRKVGKRTIWELGMGSVVGWVDVVGIVTRR